MKRNTLLWALVATSVLALLIQTAAAEAEDDADARVEHDLKDEKVGLKTDSNVEEREERAMSHEGYSVEELNIMKKQAEMFAFQAEVTKLMDIIINSLYSSREVFLRELISNASDALDKIRFLGLTKPELLGQGELARLDIRVKANPEAGTLEITDKGIGMTKDELVKNLGTIAQSGTTEFLKDFVKGDESMLIGKFGVGFYSAFLISDIVTVTSKSNDDADQWIWKSDASGSFSIMKDPHGNTLGRGTKITMLLKEDAREYLQPGELKSLLKKFSEYINFPIYLWNSRVEEREVTEEVEAEESILVGEEPKVEDIDIDAELEGEEGKEKPTKTITETVWDWELANELKPLWLRNPKEISLEEYHNFYKAMTKDTEEPIVFTHFTAEGETEFKALLFAPKTAPADIWNPDPQAHMNFIKLYVHRVFITGDFYDIMPSYLRFIRGVVDSDDLPLNVSREQIQESKILEAIKKKLVRKSVAMFQELFKEDRVKFDEFFAQYGTHLKMGAIDDVKNRDRLMKLLLFHSSKSDKLVTLEEYVERMKEGQEEIYVIAGPSMEAVSKSPLIEGLLKNDYEVLYLISPIDEYLISAVPKFDSKYKFTNVAKDGVKLNLGQDEEKEKAQRQDFQDLSMFLQGVLSDNVERVVTSAKLTQSPAVLVSSNFGYTANMERLMKAQAFSSMPNMQGWKPKKVMEINPEHPIVVEMKKRLEQDRSDPTLIQTANMLYRTAALSGGYSVDDPAQFAAELNKLIAESLSIKIEEAPLAAEEKKEEL